MSGAKFKIGSSEYVFVVLGPGHPGAGRIKRIPLEKNINSTLIEWDGDVRRISKQEENSGSGSRFLDDLYEEDGHPERFAVYCEWAKAGSEGRTISVPEFPAELLPRKVVEWRNQGAKSSAQFDPFAMAASLSGGAPALPEAPAEPAPAETQEPARKGGKAARVEPRIPTTIPLEAPGE